MFYKSVKVWMRESVWKCKRVNSEIDFCTDLRAVGAKVALQTPDHPPLRKPLHFFCPFKSFLVTQSNLNKWRGATPPSGMVLFLTNQYLPQSSRLLELARECSDLPTQVQVQAGGGSPGIFIIFHLLETVTMS